MECICGRRERRSTAPFLRPRSIECPCEAAAAPKSRKAIQCASGVTRVNLDGLAVDPAQLTHAIQKRLPQLTGGLFRANQKHSDPPHLDGRVLRARAKGRNVAWRDPAMNWRRACRLQGHARINDVGI